MLGASLFFGDSIITPSISVLSALEGLAVNFPSLDGRTMPMALGVLIGLFLIQRWGTGFVGRSFGPIMLVYFVTLAITGIEQIVQAPRVFEALNPARAVAFLNQQQQNSTLLPALGGIVLSVTGGEALYADMGHFGKLPIRLAWFSVVLPCLSLNYLGQGALILNDVSKAQNPFFFLFPGYAAVPSVVLATIATVIASQAPPPPPRPSARASPTPGGLVQALLCAREGRIRAEVRRSFITTTVTPQGRNR